jgi:hypothetical protein
VTREAALVTGEAFVTEVLLLRVVDEASFHVTAPASAHWKRDQARIATKQLGHDIWVTARSLYCWQGPGVIRKRRSQGRRPRSHE